MSDEGAFQIWQCQKCGRRYMPQELDTVPFILGQPEISDEEVTAFEAEFMRVIEAHIERRIIVPALNMVKLILACGHHITDLFPAPPTSDVIGTPL